MLPLHGITLRNKRGNICKALETLPAHSKYVIKKLTGFANNYYCYLIMHPQHLPHSHMVEDYEPNAAENLRGRKVLTSARSIRMKLPNCKSLGCRNLRKHVDIATEQ